MKKVSIIIPTLQKNITILKLLLEQLNKDKSVSEIILIDNSRKGFESDLNKLRVIIPPSEPNLYVNQSWNLGVKEAKEEYYALFNDDLLVCEDFCSKVLNLIENVENFGCLGMSNNSVINTDVKNYPEVTDFSIAKDDGERPYNWGTVIFGKKDLYEPIPSNIKVWAGDDFVRYSVQKFGGSVFVLNDTIIYHLGGLSSNNPQLNIIKHRDVFNMGKVFPEFKKTKTYRKIYSLDAKFKKIMRKVFSWRNSDDKKFKIITILGFDLYCNNC